MIFINGAPGTGKTTLAEALHKATGRKVIHTDDYLHLEHPVKQLHLGNW